MDAEEERGLTELARNLTRGRELASNMALPFVSRLLDLSLLELAMVWHGKTEDPARPAMDRVRSKTCFSSSSVFRFWNETRARYAEGEVSPLRSTPFEDDTKGRSGNPP